MLLRRRLEVYRSPLMYRYVQLSQYANKAKQQTFANTHLMNNTVLLMPICPIHLSGNPYCNNKRLVHPELTFKFALCFLLHLTHLAHMVFQYSIKWCEIVRVFSNLLTSGKTLNPEYTHKAFSFVHI